MIRKWIDRARFSQLYDRLATTRRQSGILVVHPALRDC
jgi:hypothetical protein